MFEESTGQEERFDLSDVTQRNTRDGGRSQLDHEDSFVATRLQGRHETAVGGLIAIGMHHLVEPGRSRERHGEHKPCNDRADEREAGSGHRAESRRHHGTPYQKARTAQLFPLSLDRFVTCGLA